MKSIHLNKRVMYVCLFVCFCVCPFIAQESVDRFWCGVFHWIAQSNKSDMDEKKWKRTGKGCISCKKYTFSYVHVWEIKNIFLRC